MEKVNGHRIVMVVVLIFVTLLHVTAHGTSEENFGIGIKVLNQQAPYTGDFNGDGTTDNLFLLWLSSKSRISGGVKLINPWSADESAQPSVEIADESVALGLAHGGEKGNKVVIYDPEFLSTPMWKEKSLPV